MNREKYIKDKSYREGYKDGRKEGIDAVINTCNAYLYKLEENIIISHMFPFYKALPKYKESWLVNTVDNAMAFYERYFTIKDKVKSMLENNPIYERLKVNN